MYKKNFKKRITGLVLGFFCALQLTAQTVPASQYWPEEISVNSPNAIVMEMNTGTILYDKNSKEARYPASITKIMTTMLALENSELNEMVTFSDEAIDNTEGSGIARDYGEQMTMEDCLYAIMLESANECAYAVAEHISGSIEAFADLMNAKAKELGCVNTNFVNPHGLHDDNHYTCCYDMALIAKAAYENETFRIITSTKARMIPPTNKHAEETPLQNHNKLLHRYQKGNYVYEYCTGGKTGYTTNANATLVTFAEKDGMALVCVVMNTDGVSEWTDSRALFDYCFDNFQLLNVSENETGYEVQKEINANSLSGNPPFVELDKNACILLPKTVEFTEAESEVTLNREVSNIAGTISHSYAGRSVGKADIVTTGAVIEEYIFDNQIENAAEEEETIQLKPSTIVAIAAMICLLIVMLLLGKYVYDNIYIIRHNLSVQMDRRERFREIKKRKQRRRRRR